MRNNCHGMLRSAHNSEVDPVRHPSAKRLVHWFAISSKLTTQRCSCDIISCGNHRWNEMASNSSYPSRRDAAVTCQMQCHNRTTTLFLIIMWHSSNHCDNASRVSFWWQWVGSGSGLGGAHSIWNSSMASSSSVRSCSMLPMSLSTSPAFPSPPEIEWHTSELQLECRKNQFAKETIFGGLKNAAHYKKMPML